jgi:Flp pilus assembly pilin Flp
MTEYIIIVSLIAIAAIGIVTLFGDNVRALFGMASNALAGETDVKNRTKVSKGDALEKKKLATATQENGGY